MTQLSRESRLESKTGEGALAARTQYRLRLHGWFAEDAERLAGFYRRLEIEGFAAPVPDVAAPTTRT